MNNVVKTEDQRTAQVVAQLNELEGERLDTPTLPGDPRQEKVQKLKKLRARLGEEVHWHHVARVEQLDTDQLLEQLESVASPTTYADRVIAWVYIYALADREPKAEAAFLEWRDQDTPRGQVRDESPAAHIIAALTGKEPEPTAPALARPGRLPRYKAAGLALAGVLLAAAILATITLT